MQAKCASHPLENAILYCTSCDSHQTACLTCVIANGRHHDHRFTSLDDGLKAIVGRQTGLIESVRSSQQNVKSYYRELECFDKRLLRSLARDVSRLNKTVDKLIDDLQQVRVALQTATIRAAQTARCKATGDVELSRVVQAVRKSTQWINQCRKSLDFANLSTLSTLCEQTPSLDVEKTNLQKDLQVLACDFSTVQVEDWDDLGVVASLNKLGDITGNLRKQSDELVERKQPEIKRTALFVTGNSLNNSTYTYIPTHDAWRKAAPFTKERYGAAATVWKGKLVFAGGWGTGGFLNSVEQYDPETNAWTGLPDMQHGRQWLALVSFEDELFAIGGFNDGGALNTVETYDKKSDQWQLAAPLNENRAYVCGAPMQTAILVAGGRGSSQSTQETCELYESVSQAWKYVASLVTARREASAATLNNRVYVFGGRNKQNEYLDSVEQYDAAADKWTVLQVRLSVPRSDTAAAAVDDRIYICGGRSDATWSCRIVECFNAREASISCTTELPGALSGAAAVSMPVSSEFYKNVFED